MIPENVLLEGAPDALIGTPEAKGNAVQAMQLEMSSDVLDELLECIRQGKPPQILFGRNPVIRYDGKSHGLHTTAEKFRHELYRSDEDDEDQWKFAGLVNHAATIQKIEEASANADKAMEALKNNMASIEQKREAQKLTVSTPEMRPSKGKNTMSKAQSRANLLRPLLANSARSLPSSPALGASTPSHPAAPHSASLNSTMPNTVAARKALTHLLAVKPQTYDRCRFTVHFNPRDLLDKVGKKLSTDEWTLSDRAYKDLDLWKFNYRKDEDRQAAIENAIRAFDRMRIPKEDNLWQMLLKPEERGKGKVLSRLNLQQAPQTSTPAVKAKSYDRKTGLPKKTEAKKAANKEGAKAKKHKDSQEENTKPNKPASDARAAKQEAAKEKQTTKRKDKNADDSRTPIRKQVKPSTAAKSLLNKPKNPSPLSASPPVNASDFEDNHPVHKALSAAVSPKRPNKRKADVMNGDTHGLTKANKRAHLNSSSSEEHQAATTNGNGMTNGHHSPQSDSSGSPPITLSWRQSVEMAKKFRLYYDRYAKLWTELSNSPTPPSQAKREELMKMHRTLESMKRDVRNGAL